MVQLEAGPDGKVWGVNSKNELYRRSGVSTTVPMGKSWMKVGGPPFKFVTVGKDQLYSIDLGNTVFSGTLKRVGAGQKLPGMANVRFWYDKVYSTVIIVTSITVTITIIVTFITMIFITIFMINIIIIIVIIVLMFTIVKVIIL